MDLEKYRTLFVDEATDHLGEMARAVGALEKRSSAEESAEAVECLFRMAHSIKGMAASLEYSAPEALAHRLEDWMEPMRSEGSVGDAGIGLLYDTVAALELMIQAVAESRPIPEPDRGLLERLASVAPASETDRCSAAHAEDARPEPSAAPLPPTVRVRAEQLDGFLASVGELLQHQARVESLVRDIPYFDGRTELSEELERMESMATDLRRRALQIRTTPVRRLFERVPRLASELARRLGKRVEVVLEGDEVEADRAVLDHLDDALTHLIRNALDHGIEPPAEREARGKSPVGRIRLSASKVGSRIHLRVSEDGGGIDVEGIRRKAIERGLLVEAVAEDLPEATLYDLIFEPGMSTRESVTALSGRGVGLDAVRRSIQALGGSIRVEAASGQGTTFDLDLPSSVAVQRLLVLDLGGPLATLPASRVERVVAVADGLVEGVGGDAFFVWHDEPLPLLDLCSRLGLPGPHGEARGAALLLEVEGFRLALRVDRVVGEVEVFVRELPRALQGNPLLGGVAMLPDGAPVFLLEPAGLVEESY
jgi:two-component system chemotaxis sensor kinase CheA